MTPQSAPRRSSASVSTPSPPFRMSPQPPATKSLPAPPSSVSTSRPASKTRGQERIGDAVAGQQVVAIAAKKAIPTGAAEANREIRFAAAREDIGAFGTLVADDIPPVPVGYWSRQRRKATRPSCRPASGGIGFHP